MPRIKKIGTPLVRYNGKTIFEIVSYLKNVGACRMVSRTSWQQYPEKSFVMVTRGYPNLKDEGFDGGVIYGKKMFRNFPITPEVKIKEAFIPDWFLIPKHEEKFYISLLPPPQPKIVSKYIDIPPLLRLLMLRDIEKSGKVVQEEPKILKQVLPKSNIIFKD